MPKQPDNAPRISLNKLAEFTAAKPQRQRQILRDQKYPTDFKGMYYKESSESISSFLASGSMDMAIIYNAISVLEQKSPQKVGTQRRINANIDALENFEAMLDIVDFSGVAVSLGEPFPEKLSIQNVSVSVRPEIILRAPGKNNTQLVGAVKLYFPKTFSLNSDSAGYISATLQEWCRTCLADEGVTAPHLCYVIEVGAQEVWPGVKATAQRMKDLAAYCQNIAALWPTIKAND